MRRRVSVTGMLGVLLGPVLLGATLLGPVLLAGCGDACAELQTVCDDCTDPNHRAACEASVDDGVQDTCEQNIDSFGNVCK